MGALLEELRRLTDPGDPKRAGPPSGKIRPRNTQELAEEQVHDSHLGGGLAQSWMESALEILRFHPLRRESIHGQPPPIYYW
jgi:hypothetical protein